MSSYGRRAGGLTSSPNWRGIDAAADDAMAGGGLMGRFAQGAVVAAFVLGLLAAGSGAPAFAQAKKLDFAYILAPPESGAVAFKWMAEEVTKRSSGTLNMVFHGGTLLNKEIEIM